MDCETIKRRLAVDKYEAFKQECQSNAEAQASDEELLQLSKSFFSKTFAHKYSYNFQHLGRPIIQYPQDIVAMQELIWYVRPDLIIETGIAHGGSLILSASMLALLDMCDAIAAQQDLNIHAPKRKVIGVDIDIRPHNRAAIETHPMANRIELLQGSSIAPEIIAAVSQFAQDYKRVFVCLDSNHSHEHVLAELTAYASLVSSGSYCVVFDTVVEDLPAELLLDRPWGPGNSPKTAVWEYLETNKDFSIDDTIDKKLLLSVAPNGFLKRK